MNKQITFFASIAFLLLLSTSFYKVEAQPCTASFVWNQIPGQPVMMFNSTSTAQPGDSIISYEWNFGDNTFDTIASPIHTYLPGQYTVCLKISSQLGCIDSICQNIVVMPCTLFVSITVDSVNNTMTSFVQGGSPPYTYSWSNGATGPVITGITQGTYCVVVTDGNGCTGSACANFNSTNCNAIFYPQYNCNGGSITFIISVMGVYDSLMWDFGDMTYSTQQQPTHTYSGAGMYIVTLTTYAGGLICSQYSQSVVAPSPATSNLCGYVWVDGNNNGVFDSTETLLSNQYVGIYGNNLQCTGYTDLNGYFNFNIPPGTYTIYYCPDTTNGYVQTYPVDSNPYCGIYQNVVIASGQTICGYNFAVQPYAVVLEGRIFGDANNNGVYDGGEYGIPYQPLTLNAYTIYSGSQGIFSMNQPLGNYTLNYSPSGPYAVYPLSTPSTINVNAATAGVYSGNNFGLDIPQGTNNLSINLAPYTTIRPGFPAYYHIQVYNIGATASAPVVTMNYHPLLTFNSASPVETTHNSTTHVITWNLPAILPMQSAVINVNFTTSTSATFGTVLTQNANVSPSTGTDVDLSNNYDTICQTVTNSWDPNNKLVTRTNYYSNEFQMIQSLNADQQLEYVINFQNTGTAPAVNINVIDELSSDLDANSFQLLSTSHNCNALRIGNEVQYTFNNINLADSLSNEPQSHGWIKFRINANNNLTAGTVISDFSKIYFDFNQPVITNNAIVTMINSQATTDLTNDYQLSVYPNPVNAQSQLSYYLKEQAQVQVAIYDAAGKMCNILVDKNEAAGVHQLNLNNKLQKGIYTIHFTINQNCMVKKFVVLD